MRSTPAGRTLKKFFPSQRERKKTTGLLTIFTNRPVGSLEHKFDEVGKRAATKYIAERETREEEKIKRL